MPHRSLLALALVISAVASADPVAPLLRAHAHNDYEHTCPLLDALNNGFCSVEADIYLVNGALLVAHNPGDVKPERTLQALYFDPLLARVKANNGRVYSGGPTITLLVDFKSEAEETYKALSEALVPYHEMLSEYTDTATEARAVSIIISGNRPLKTLAAEPKRFAALDGRIPDLKKNTNPRLYPMISSSWSPMFRWNGEGEIPETEKKRLEDYVAQAHANGQTLRFWATPDKPEVWKVLDQAGVDYINTDDLAGLRAYFGK